MDLADSFTYEDLPTRDADTGYLTAAGWIPLTMKYSSSAAIAILCFHTVQSTIRIVTNHETIIIAWYPFDWTVSPFYEQVTISKTEFSSIFSYRFLYLIFCIHWNIPFYVLSFFLSFFLSYFFTYFSSRCRPTQSVVQMADKQELEKMFNANLLV